MTRRRSARTMRAPVLATLALSVFCWSPVTQAHGPPAAVTGLTASRPDGVAVVAATEGLVQRAGGTWRYVCPVQFGDELSPPALSVDGSRTFVVGQDDLFVLDADGSVSAQARPDLSRQFVLGLAGVEGRLYASRFADGQTEIRQIEPDTGAPLWQNAGPYDALTPALDGFWVARTEGTMGHATHIDTRGQSTDERAFAVTPGDIVGRVEEARGTLYISLLTSGLSGKLLSVGADAGATVLAETNAPVQGPIALADGSVFVAADGVLDALGASGVSPVAAARATCVGRLGDLGYLCSRTRLLSLAASGPGSTLFDLAAIRPPELALVRPDVRDACTVQWTVFRNDLRAIGALGPADAGLPPPEAGTDAPPQPSSGGCALGRGAGRRQSSGAVPGAVALLLSLRRRRARRSARARGEKLRSDRAGGPVAQGRFAGEDGPSPGSAERSAAWLARLLRVASSSLTWRRSHLPGR